MRQPLSARSSTPLAIRWGAAVAAVLTAASTASPANAHPQRGPQVPVEPQVVATGLDNPRHLTFAANGDLYVAEAGSGGTGPCLPGAEGGEVCFGKSGAITRVSDLWHRRSGASQTRVVTDLPSLAEADGGSAIGASDIDVEGWGDWSRLSIVIGLGHDPAVRDANPELSQMATLVQTRPYGDRLWTVADLGAHETAENPVNDFDSNPVSVLRRGSRFVVADAGGNTVVRVNRRGGMRNLAALPDVFVDAPPFLGLPPGTQIPVQAVPTSVAIGPDRAYYVSQLTGFPFQAGLSKIWRVDRAGGTPTVYAEGLTNVTDLEFADDGTLYAVEISAAGLLNGPIGALVKVTPSGPQVVKGDLDAPYGLALKGRSAYVTTGSTTKGGGQVIRIPLP